MLGCELLNFVLSLRFELLLDVFRNREAIFYYGAYYRFIYYDTQVNVEVNFSFMRGGRPFY